VTSADLRPLERSLLIAACCAAPVVLFLIVYVVLPNHGLMIDDYAWILQSRVRAIDDLLGLFTHSSGFYRPIVGVSFALNNAIAGSHVASYGIVNVAIALACAAAIRSLGRALGLTRGAALFMACVWLLNFQGIRTAVQWVSGRSELLLVLFLALSATALVRHRLVASVVWLSLALFTKEEAIVFPAILLVWMYLLRKDGRWTRTSLVTWTVGTAGVALLYLLARHAAGAITPATAPEYYRFTFAPQTIWRHAYIYADQILTFPLLVTGVATLLLGRAFDAGIRTSKPASVACALGALWVLGGYALTLFVPVRSDLYSCLPSVGVCLVAAVWCERAWQHASTSRRTRALAAILVACIVLSPVYYLRTRSRSRLMAFGAQALNDIEQAVATLPSGSEVVIYDDPDARATNTPNLEDAFGSMLDEAYELVSGRRMQFRIEVPDDAGPEGALRLQLVDGRVRAWDDGSTR
jgi:hypothetical protein